MVSSADSSVAGLGVLTTAYLTVVKLTQSTAAYQKLRSVLASDYATFGTAPRLIWFSGTSMVYCLGSLGS